MATFEDYLPWISPHVPLASDPLIENSFRKMVIDFCERTYYHKYDSPAVNVTKDVAIYNFVTPAGHQRVRTETVTFKNDSSILLQPVTESQLGTLDGGWMDRTGTPTSYLEWDMGSLRLFPTPATTSTNTPLIIRISLRPDATPSITGVVTASFNDVVCNDNWRTLVNGTLFTLFNMHTQPWYHPNAAGEYAVAYRQGVIEATTKASQGNVKSVRKVRYGGLFTPNYNPRISSTTW